MSDNIIPFNNGNEDSESCCPQCDIAHEFVYIVLDTLENGTVEDLFGVLRGLVEEAGKLSLIEYLEHELDHKSQLIDTLIYGVDEE